MTQQQRFVVFVGNVINGVRAGDLGHGFLAVRIPYEESLFSIAAVRRQTQTAKRLFDAVIPDASQA